MKTPTKPNSVRVLTEEEIQKKKKQEENDKKIKEEEKKLKEQVQKEIEKSGKNSKKSKVETHETQEETDHYNETKENPKSEPTLLGEDLYKEYVTNSRAQLGRLYSVSIALPGSILEAYSSQKDMTLFIGQIARYVAIFGIDEVIIYNEKGKFEEQQDPAELTKDLNIFFGNVLQYCEAPPYLRKALFPRHPDLQYAEILPPLGIDSHKTDLLKYKEGVMVKRNQVNIGLKEVCYVDRELEKDTRVTVHIYNIKDGQSKGKILDPNYPKEKDGLCWGYTTRVAESFSKIWTESIYKESYDYTIGVTEDEPDVDYLNKSRIPEFRRLLIVFGKGGVKNPIESDATLKEKDPKKVFNVLYNPYSMKYTSLKPEEVFPMTMSCLQSEILSNVVPKSMKRLSKRVVKPH